MGCCGSKEDDGIVSQTADVATAAGGAVVGAAGAVVGGTVAVARGGVALVPGGRNLLEHVDDATGAFADATVKTGELVAEATKKVASQADFMKIISSPEVQAKLPKIGVLRCARAKFMPAQLSVGSNSYLYTTVQAEVQGLPYADVRAGKPLDAAQTKALKVNGRHCHRHIHHHHHHHHHASVSLQPPPSALGGDRQAGPARRRRDHRRLRRLRPLPGRGAQDDGDADGAVAADAGADAGGDVR